VRLGIEVTSRALHAGQTLEICESPTTEDAIDDVVRTPDWASPTSRSAKPGWRAFPLSIDFVALYPALDRLSFIGGLHRIPITRWDPSAGLAMTLRTITSHARKQCGRRSTSKQRSSPVCQWSWLTRFRSAGPAEPATECDGGDEATNTERRSIIIEVRRTAKHAIEVSVADSGPGVAPRCRRRSLSPYDDQISGSGDGAFDSRAIIESHGGSLRMARGVRSGAVFIFHLPTVEAETSANAG